jgi:predicted DNA-binding transcriptional regulator AlpA
MQQQSSTVLIDQQNVRLRTGLSGPTLWRMRRDGTGPDWCRLGRRILYSAQGLEDWISERMQSSGTTPR